MQWKNFAPDAIYQQGMKTTELPPASAMADSQPWPLLVATVDNRTHWQAQFLFYFLKLKPF